MNLDSEAGYHCGPDQLQVRKNFDTFCWGHILTVWCVGLNCSYCISTQQIYAGVFFWSQSDFVHLSLSEDMITIIF